GDRTIQSAPGRWDLGRDRTGLLGCLERCSPLTQVAWRMQSSHCKQCDQPLVEIDHWGERLTDCPICNRWQASTGEWCRLAPDDITALRALKARKTLHSEEQK